MIDDHVHPFPLRTAPFDPAQLSLDVTAGPAADERRHRSAASRLAVELLSVRLAQLLDVPVEEMGAARDEAAGDWPAYARRLMDDAGVEGMVMDPVGEPGAQASLSPYAELVDRPVWALQRLEPTLDALIAAGVGAAEIVAAVDALVSDAAGRGCVGVKTVLAYRTGLAVQADVDLAGAERSLAARETADIPVRRRAKGMRDLVLRRVMARCADLDLALQVHTGFGDSEIAPRTSDPLLLDEVLRTPEGAAARVVLIHGSWPWHDSAAYLASVRPRVWAELSLTPIFAPAGTAERLLRLLDTAPADRVLVGSDGHGSLESIWYGARVLQAAWTTVRERLIATGARASWADGVGAAVLSGTAREVYRLPDAPGSPP